MPNATRPLPGSLSALRALLPVPTPARSYASPVIETAVIDCSPRESDAKSRPTPPQPGLFHSTILSSLYFYISNSNLSFRKLQTLFAERLSFFILYIFINYLIFPSPRLLIADIRFNKNSILIYFNIRTNK